MKYCYQHVTIQMDYLDFTTAIMACGMTQARIKDRIQKMNVQLVAGRVVLPSLELLKDTIVILTARQVVGIILTKPS